MNIKKKISKKIFVIVISILFLAIGISTSIAGNNKDNQNTSSITFYTFDKTGTKKCKVELLNEISNYIYEKFLEVKNKITTNPYGDETKILKNEFVDILEKYELIPKKVSKADVLTIMNPRLQRFTEKTVFPRPFTNTASAFICSMAGEGYGVLFTPIMFPRPRITTVWSSAINAESMAANLLTGFGFFANGPQFGVAIGFMGIGLSFAIPGLPAYFGFGGYALATFVGAEEIETYPPNQEPIITNENPPSGTGDVPLSLSELSFHISDADGDRMSYTVTTNPDIGSVQGNGYDGEYSLQINNLECDKIYSWTVSVSDGTDTVEKVFGFFTEAGPPFNPFYEGWRYRKKITIDHNKIEGNLEDFPILVSLIDTNLASKAQIDGDDILFMDGTGVANKLYHEIEKYDDSTGELVAWVKIPSLSSIVDTELYMYYGNVDCSNQQFSERVWDENYVMVHHMIDKPDNKHISDSTFNNLNGYKKESNEPNQQYGIIGYGQKFDGEDDYIYVNSDTRLDAALDDRTYEVWIKVSDDIDTGDGTGRFIFSKQPNIGREPRTSMAVNKEAGVAVFLFEGSENGNTSVIRGNTDIRGETCYIVGIRDRDADELRLYLNGNQDNDPVIDGDQDGSNDGELCIGDQPSVQSNGRVFKDIIDEIRVSTVVRSDAWIKTSFNSMNDPFNFYSIGPEESGP
jgi:hypothetical protein